jgi:hypothetical protein
MNAKEGTQCDIDGRENTTVIGRETGWTDPDDNAHIVPSYRLFDQLIRQPRSNAQTNNPM